MQCWAVSLCLEHKSMHGKCFKTIVTETLAIYHFFNHSDMTPFSAYPSQQIRIAREPPNIGVDQDRVWSSETELKKPNLRVVGF
jgi:hypothetical protein